MTPRAVLSSVDEPPGRSDLGMRRTPQLQVRATAVPAEAGRGRQSGSAQVKPTILTLARPCGGQGSCKVVNGRSELHIHRWWSCGGEEPMDGGGLVGKVSLGG